MGSAFLAGLSFWAGFVHTQKMVRVGVDENLAQELLGGFSA